MTTSKKFDLATALKEHGFKSSKQRGTYSTTEKLYKSYGELRYNRFAKKLSSSHEVEVIVEITTYDGYEDFDVEMYTAGILPRNWGSATKKTFNAIREAVEAKGFEF